MDSPNASTYVELLVPPPRASSTGIKCAQCNPHQKERRNLIVCIDGTSNTFGWKNTNVVKIFDMIDQESKNPEQHAYYSSGIGARAKPLGLFGTTISDALDMAFALSIAEAVRDSYGWLARMYREGDQIYLFGFSRGAYQVQALAGMIHEVGLIKTPTESQIRTAYHHYEALRSKSGETRQMAKAFKNTFSWKDLRVHFVGVWDTVSSVGLRRGSVFPPPAHVCHSRHALALDERRVKFIPEYFREMNIRTDDKHMRAATSTNEGRNPTMGDGGNLISGGTKNWTTEVKEVWFAGSHSDVGGTNRPGKSYHAGNASLSWMRQEAAENGLKLRPTDIVWVPGDLDFGVEDSMTKIWRIVECLPINHQASFGGSGGKTQRRCHWGQPRRIIPGQKVHTSVLYANAYTPRASLGEGFDIPVAHTKLATDPDDPFWEAGHLDGTAAQQLVTSLGAQQGVTPICLDRLLFMLRFKEGRQHIRGLQDWRGQFNGLIKSGCTPLVRLVTIIAYYEASDDPDMCPHIELPQDISDDAKKCLRDILSTRECPDGPSVVALIQPLTRHRLLRTKILTQGVLETLVNLLDENMDHPGGNFGQMIEGLDCLLQCEGTQDTIIEKLGETYPYSEIPRLSEVLAIKDPHLLTAALRMVATLARIPKPGAKAACSQVKPRIRELAKSKGLIGVLSVEVLLALWDESEENRLARHKCFRANLSSALTRLSTGLGNEQGHGADPWKQVLGRVFDLNAPELGRVQQGLVDELRKAVQKCNIRERTAATLTLLKLCEEKIIRTYLLRTDLLVVFVTQLRRKDTALLAAYALAGCLKYDDMKETLMKNQFLASNIVDMLRLDYFDDAVGPIEGFEIFSDFLQHGDLRGKIESNKVAEVLTKKLVKGRPKETRTSLVCLNIFRSLDGSGSCTEELVNESLKRLRNQKWKVQKEGVTILSALAQTEHGVEAICPKIDEVIEMVLEGNSPKQPTAEWPTTARPVSSKNKEEPDLTTPESSVASKDRSARFMLGPACALRVLVQNKMLRDRTRESVLYGKLKRLWLTGKLSTRGTSPFFVYTPSRADVSYVVDKIIKIVDEELSEDQLTLMKDVLPHINHWKDAMLLLSLDVILIIPAVLCANLLSIAIMAALAPVYLPFLLCASVACCVRRQHPDIQDPHDLRREPGDEETRETLLQQVGNELKKKRWVRRLAAKRWVCKLVEVYKEHAF